MPSGARSDALVTRLENAATAPAVRRRNLLTASTQAAEMTPQATAVSGGSARGVDPAASPKRIPAVQASNASLAAEPPTACSRKKIPAKIRPTVTGSQRPGRRMQYAVEIRTVEAPPSTTQWPAPLRRRSNADETVMREIPKRKQSARHGSTLRPNSLIHAAAT